MGAAIDAIGPAIEENYEKMATSCRKKLKCPQDAEEALHNAITKALDFADRYPDAEIRFPKSWLWRILNNTIVDTYRANGKVVRDLSLDYGFESVKWIGAANNNDPDSEKMPPNLRLEPDYAKELHNKQVVEATRRMYRHALTNQQRRALIMRFEEGMPFLEIGKVIFPQRDPDKATQAVKALIHRGRTALRVMSKSAVYARYFAT